jgi:tol-pal system protein YbgF
MISGRNVVLCGLALGCALVLVATDHSAAQQGEASLAQEVRQLTESVQGARQDLMVVQRTQARTMATVEELQTVVQTVDAKLEEFNHRLRELSQRLDALQASLSQARLRLAEPLPPASPSEPTPFEVQEEAPKPLEPQVSEAPPPDEGDKPQAPAPELEVASAPPPEAEVKPEPPAGPITRQTVEVAVLDPKEIFKAAQEDYVKGSYDLAILGFRDYLRKYPGTDLAPNAQYLLGEIYLSQQEYEKAIGEFKLLMDVYPKSPKVPTALYKQGLAYRELKQFERARANLEALVSQFSTTAEAKQAEEIIKTLPEVQVPPPATQ